MNLNRVRRRMCAVWLACAMAAAATSVQALPSFQEVRQEFRPSETLFLDRRGEVLQRLRTDDTVRRGQWVALADVSPAFRQALLLSEDQRFYEHSGVDWRAVSAAAWGNLWHQRTRGASTITMQLAGLLEGPESPFLRQGPGGRTVVQKLGQTVAAQVLERRWRKDEILEAYLNLVPFRGELVGMDALSRTLFGKAAHGLDDREAAVAAALVRAPNARPAQVAQRACAVLRELQRGAATDCAALEWFTSAALQRRAFEAQEGIAPHVARYVWRQRERDQARPLSISTTLDARLQRVAWQALGQQLRELRGRNVEDGAVLVLDNATGAVLAWVGSSGGLSQAAEVDGVLALRQPGSTLKPFLYGQALAERRITAASLVQDSSAHIPTSGGLYIPQNYDRQFKGWVSVRTALAASLNVPAVRTLVMVTPDAFHRQLGALGLPLKETGDYYGFSLALGSAEVPLLHLTNAYRSLANGGRFSTVHAVPQPRSTTSVRWTPALDAGAAFIVGDILSDPNARARTFGTDSVLATRFWTAVKTGTSKDMRDNWAVGWSQRYTVGVWVGNASGAPMHDVSGTSGAAPIWAGVMGYLHAREPSRAPKAPPGLQRATVRFGLLGTDKAATAYAAAPATLEAPRDEWFLPGTQQAVFAMDSGAAYASGKSAGAQKTSKPLPEADALPLRIVAPAPGTIVALDPDIPPERQRLQLVASRPGGVWVLDGKRLGQGERLAWLPWPGRHQLQLTDGRGTILDELRLEVRGAGVARR